MKNHTFMREDDNGYLVHNGKKAFTVAKKGLSKKMQERIKGLPHYADGGIVEKEETAIDKAKKEVQTGADFMSELMQAPPEGSPLADIYNTFESAAAQFAKGGEYNPNVVYPEERALSQVQNLIPGAEAAPNDPNKGFATTGPAPMQQGPEPASEGANLMVSPAVPGQPTPQTPSSPDFYKQWQSQMGQQAQGIQKEADLYSQQQKEAAEIRSAYEIPGFKEKLQERMQSLENERQKVTAELDELRQSALKNEIDPNRVWASKSTGNKILTAIGLVLGGAGGGSNPANNAALSVLNKQISADIEAQKANASQQMNLYKINLQRYNDINAAEQATRLQLNEIVQGQIEGLSAKYGGPIAQAKAQQMIAKLKQDSMKTGLELYQNQKKQKFMEAIKNSAGSLPPEQGIRYLIPEKFQKDAYKELGALRDIEASLANVQTVMNDAFENSKAATNAKNPIQAKQLRAAAYANLFPIVKSIVGERMSDADAKALIEPYLPGLTTSEATFKKNVQALENSLRSKIAARTPLLTSYGLARPPKSAEQLGLKKR